MVANLTGTIVRSEVSLEWHVTDTPSVNTKKTTVVVDRREGQWWRQKEDPYGVVRIYTLYPAFRLPPRWKGVPRSYTRFVPSSERGEKDPKIYSL